MRVWRPEAWQIREEGCRKLSHMALATSRIAERENNFNLLRILAAGAVLVSHAYPISLGPGSVEPLDHVLGMSLGTLAVITFFSISGYFISQSFHNRHSVIEFAAARALRIYPGLLVVLLLTVLVLGPVFTKIDLALYFSDRDTLLYIPRNLRLWRLQYELPGVFSDNAYPGAINGPLWTLAYEVACYTMVAAVGKLGLTLNSTRFARFLAAYVACYVVALPLVRSSSDHLMILRNIHLLSLPFVIGMTLFQFRHRIPFNLLTLSVFFTASLISYRSPWFHELFLLAWSYAMLYLGFLKYKPLLTYNRLGDYSYGMYIYAFPVQQAISALYKGCTPVIMIASSLPATFALAIFSWHFVEKRALAQRANIVERIRGLREVVWADPTPK
jgi:peptidoglycan/LPS O-acetylase OafA/YrhL